MRQLPSGEENVFEGFIGDLGGRPGAWANDSQTLAVKIDGAEVTHVVVLEIGTGRRTDLKPKKGNARNYTPSAGWFRSDGLLAVVCCYSDEDPNVPPATPDLVVHDPTTGEERERSPLQLPGSGYDYDPSWTHQLLSSRDDGIYRRADGEVTRIPDIAGAGLAVW